MGDSVLDLREGVCCVFCACVHACELWAVSVLKEKNYN